MGEARVVRPDRRQLRWEMVDLEGLLPADHRARIVGSFVERLDLSQLYDQVRSRDGEAGRPAADPAVMLALWLYATVEGVGSARELERLAESDAAYRWLAGGVPLNDHGLADFRVEQVEVLDRLLTQSVTALIDEGLVKLAEIAVDGTKVRASASRKSFKTGEKLLEVEAAVAERLAALKAELKGDAAASTRRRQAACERAARQVQERAGQALAALERLAAERKARAAKHAKDEAKKKEPKVSMSDPEARLMRFPDGAVRPAYNAQIAAAPREGVIVSIEVTDRRNDAGLAGPMVDDIARRYGRTPDKLLVDTSYATSEDIVALAAHETGPVSVYTPPPSERDDMKPASLGRRRRKREKEPGCLKEWRERMASEAGKAIYALRKRIERINADRKNHGFGFLPVRGLIKAKAHALWHALANNLLAARRLRAYAAQTQ
ncbi:MAG: IS1182 family transposase [Hyphomicrobiales bacterium]|nr:IS1182 family transposase [Hyphomicrobiales bacterium]